jgi:hypothetical protein
MIAFDIRYNYQHNKLRVYRLYMVPLLVYLRIPFEKLKHHVVSNLLDTDLSLVVKTIDVCLM